MTTFTSMYALLSDHVYLDRVKGSTVDGTPFEVLEIVEDPSGYYGILYRNQVTGELVIAHRGTELTEDTLRDLVETDGQMALFTLSQQLNGAERLVELALERSRNAGPNGEPVPISVTGHSLGGALAQITAAKYGLYGETFNAYGAAGMYGTPAGGGQVVNYVRATDLVSAAGTHFGSVKIYATEEDKRLLLLDGSPVNGFWDLIEDVGELLPSVTHDIKDFFSDDTILTPQNQARYEADQALYDTYRAQIRAVALGFRYALPAPAAVTPGLQQIYQYLLASYIKNEIINVFIGNDELEAIAGQDTRNFIRGRLGNDTISGGSQDDLLFGDAGNDTLHGLSGNDAIYGGDNDDFLEGGAGSDRLEGGQGLDTYNFSASDFSAGSEDTILDSDNEGVITFEQVPLGNHTFNRLSADGLNWQSQDGVFRLQIIVGESSSSLAIIHQPTGGRILVKDWSDGAFGIIKPDPEVPGGASALPLSSSADLFGDDGHPGPTNPISGNDSVTGLGGNDGIDGGYGNDWIDGGQGDDLVLGGPGSNQLIGGSGDDILISGSFVMGWSQWDETVFGPLLEARADVGSYGNGWYAYTADGSAYTGDAYQRLSHLGLSAWGVEGSDPNGGLWFYPNPDLHPSGADNIDAGEGADTAYGGDGGDTIHGGTGNDVLIGGRDADSISGGDDDDLIIGDELTFGTNIFVGLSQHVSTNSNASGNDILTGGAGNDRIYGQGGNDVIDGGAGNDVLSGDRLDYGLPYVINQSVVSGNDHIDGGAGNDEIYGDGGNDTLLGGSGTDTIMGDTIAIDGSQHGDDIISGGADVDTVFGMGGNDIISGDDGDDLLIGDANVLDVALQFHGHDILSGGAGNDELQGGGGNDLLDGGEDDDILFGESGSDQLLGGAGSDELAGGDGDDVLDAGDGADFLFGQAGADALSGGAGDDELQGGDGNDYLDGGDGIDRLYGQAGADNLHGGAENDELQGGGENDALDGGSGNDKLWGDAGDDTLNGGEGNDELVGGDGNDTQNGGIGDDILNGNAGNDRLLGGFGNDNLSGNEQDDTVDGGAGNDFVGGDDGNDTLLGGEGVDTVVGGSGDDVLDGGAGNDTLDGGQGSDTFLFGIGSGNDVIVTYDSSSGRIDTIQLGAGITLADLIFVRSSENTLRIELSGSADSVSFDDAFSPNPAIHQLRFDDGSVFTLDQIKVKLLEGSGSDDFIIGYGGADTIDGQAGNDHIEGRSGNDILRGGAGDDLLHGENGQDRLEGGDGDDILIGDSKWLVDNRYGEADTLIGGDGDDSMFAGGGDDILEGGAGRDSMSGDGGNDVLNGGDGDDDLSGRFNDDRLIGGLGNDHMNGGSGADTYVFGYGSGRDYISEQNSSPQYDDPISLEDIDTIEMDASVSPGDVTISRSGLDLFIGLEGSRDRIQIAGAFSYDGQSALGLIEQIRFSDGTVWNLATIKAKALVASEGDDDIQGFVDDETIMGLGGNDKILGGQGNDHIDGGTGDDTLLGAVNDTLIGGEGNDYILGNAGNDVINAGAGSDYIQGGNGNDSYLFGLGSGVDIVLNGDDGQGNDAVVMGAGLSADDVSLKRAGTNLLIEIIGTKDQLIVLDFFNMDQYAAHRQIDEIRFADNTVWDITQIMARAVDTGVGMGVRFAGSFWGNFNGNDVVVDGASLDSYLDGMSGDDFLDGGANEDVLRGGTGNDRYAFGRNYGNDTIQTNQLDEASGFDVVELGADVAPADVILGRTGDDLIIGIDGTEDSLTVLEFFSDHAGSNYLIDEVRFAGGVTWDSAYLLAHAQNLDQIVNGTASDDVIAGGFGNDVLQGGAGSDTITGNLGSDQLYGGDGSDVLRGGVGNDVLYGGAGSDTYLYSRRDGFDRIEEGVGDIGDIDVLRLGPSIGWTSEVQITRSTENGSIVVSLGYDEQIELAVDPSGNSLVEQLYFERDDVYVQVIAPQEAYLNLAFTYVLPPSFFHAEPGVGVSVVTDHLPAWMTYDSASGTLTGIPTGSINDEVAISAVHTSGKVVIAKFDLTVMNYINGTAGNDTLIGTSGRDAIFGLAGNDTLNGGGDADRMVGGIGDDIYTVNDEFDLVVEFDGEGNDLVNSSVYYRLGANVERLTLTGQAESGEGNDLANTLTGNSLENWLSGYGGNDTIDGKSGADYMEGGLGDDSYVVENVDDAVYEEAGEGYDSVSSSVSYTLSEEVEKLTLTGSSTLSATGNAADNVLVGNSGANTLTGHGGSDTLDGKGGADTLIGGTGNDTYVVDNANDSVQEIADEGIDSVQSSIAHTLANNVENLTITGTGTLAGTGNTLDNVLVGGSGANALSGLAGNDTLEGKAGTDTLTGGAGNDTYVMARTYGTDTVVENDATAGVVDVASFLSGVTYDQLWFKRPSGSNNLEITIIGTTDKLVLKDWYLGTQYRVEEIRTVDGNKVLQAANVQALVTAMAGMTQPPQGQTTLTPAQQATLAPVFASTWQNQTLMLGGAGSVTTGGNQQSLATEQGGIALQTEGPQTPAPIAVTPRVAGHSGSNVAVPPASVDSRETGEHAPLTDAYALQRQQRQRERYLAKYEMAGSENIAELESLIAAMASFSPGMSMSDALPADNANRHPMLMASPL